MVSGMNETGSQGNNSAEAVPVVGTSKALAKMIDQHKDEWPEELLRKAITAKLTLKMIEGNPSRVIDAIKENAPNAWTEMVGDLMAFAEAYGAYMARRT